MSNLLSIPFKTPSDLDIKHALSEHIRNTYTDTHPDAFKWDIAHWAGLRASVAAQTVHLNQVDVLLRCRPSP
jgi:programmed cell death 6-interacting protein